MISVALIEDNRMMRDGLTALLDQTANCKVVASASAADLSLMRSSDPDVVLIAVGFRNGDSLDLTQMARREFPGARIILMDIVPLHVDIVEFVNAGVSGFVMKDATFEDLVSTVVAVADGKHILPPQMTSTLFSQIAREGGARDRQAALSSVRITAREREVIELIEEGLSNKGIAARLEIAPQTVKSHVRNIMEKLSLHTRLQIAAHANQHRRA